MIARIACSLALWGLLFASDLTAQDAIGAAIETYIRDVLIPSGYVAEEAPANGRVYGSGYGQQFTENPERQAIIEAIADAKAAPVGRRQTRGDAEGDKSAYQWNFKNKREQELKVLELSIRLDLHRDAPPTWKPPQVIHYFTRSRAPVENALVRVSTAREHEELKFEQRVSDECVHGYLKDRRQDVCRVAFHGVPKPLWDAVQLGKPVTFIAFVHGSESYESVTGERTIASMYFVDDQLVSSLIAKYAPKEEPPPAVHPRSRTWTSADGKYKIEGYAESATAKSVTITKTDGKAVEVELSRLSRDDGDWVKAYHAALGPMQLPAENRAYGLGS